MLRCGFYEMDITPFLGCRIPGSFEKRTVEDVTDAPYAKAAVIDNGAEKIAVLCSDILYIYGESYHKILNRICAHTDLKRENVMVRFSSRSINSSSSWAGISEPPGI